MCTLVCARKIMISIHTLRHKIELSDYSRPIFVHYLYVEGPNTDEPLFACFNLVV